MFNWLRSTPVVSETWIEAVTVTDPVLKSTLVGDSVKEVISGPEKSCALILNTQKSKMKLKL